MDSDGFVGLFWMCVFAVFAWFAWVGDSKLRYEIQYNDVSFTDKPHDCEFMTAPLGRKNCKYEKEVSVTLFAIGVSGDPIISTDEGENWYKNKGGPTHGDRVFISWVKHYD